MENQFSQLVEELSQFDDSLLGNARRCSEAIPSRVEVLEAVDLRSIVFPGFFGPSELNRETLRFHVGSALVKVEPILQTQIQRGLCFVCREGDHKKCGDRARDMTWSFLRSLPEIRRVLRTDVQASYEGDPAAISPEETVFSYPGVRAITNYRFANALHRLGVPLLPRMITEHAHSRTGIDIHPGATIGPDFFIDHGTGVVIGETCVLGRRVRLYQGVTLGAKSFPLDENGNPMKGIPRHPILEDDVVVYAGATILGRVTIGKGSMIGGNVWLTRSVPPGSKVSQGDAATRLTGESAT